MMHSFDIRNSAFGICPVPPKGNANFACCSIRHSPRLALRGIEADFRPDHADTFRRDLHPELRADYVGRTFWCRPNPATSNRN